MAELPVEENPPAEGVTRVEQFLRVIESKATDPLHRRLLRSCRAPDAGSALEEELNRIVEELLA